jgi:hypothetical protein
VPAGYSLKPVLEEALSLLPQNTGKGGVFLRSDTAAVERRVKMTHLSV